MTLGDHNCPAGCKKKMRVERDFHGNGSPSSLGGVSKIVQVLGASRWDWAQSHWTSVFQPQLYRIRHTLGCMQDLAYAAGWGLPSWTKYKRLFSFGLCLALYWDAIHTSQTLG